MQLTAEGRQRDVDNRGVEDRHDRSDNYDCADAPHVRVDLAVSRGVGRAFHRFLKIRLRTIVRPCEREGTDRQHPSIVRSVSAFSDLGLAPELLAATADVGYESPSPI